MYNYAGLRLEVPPATEPVTLDYAKLHTRYDGDDEDAVLTGYLRTAREWIEAVTGRALVMQSWVVTWDRFPPYFRLPKNPVATVDALKYVDVQGVEQTLAPANYQVDAVSEPARIFPEYEFVWPTTRIQPSAVRVEFTAGYPGTADSPPDYTRIPQGLLDAILLLYGTWERQREDVVMPDVSATQYHRLPTGAKTLINQHRIFG